MMTGGKQIPCASLFELRFCIHPIFGCKRLLREELSVVHSPNIQRYKSVTKLCITLLAGPQLSHDFPRLCKCGGLPARHLQVFGEPGLLVFRVMDWASLKWQA